MKLIKLPALKDNYIWILANCNNHCIIIDPGVAFPVFKILQKNQWIPEAILLTHNHYDHVNGVLLLKKHFPNIKIFGPEETKHNGTEKIVHGGDTLYLIERKFLVISTPGHTIGHLSYFSYPYFFCGDTLFSGGCGKVLSGMYPQMYQSLKTINNFPEKTLICCAHEYTSSNMKFATSILPNNLNLKNYYKIVNQLRSKGQTTLPTTLSKERKINLFLNLNYINISKNNSTKTLSLEERFIWLRSKKNCFF